MKIMSKLTLKELFKNKKNFILCFISVLLSCILLFSVGLAFSTIRQNKINNIIDLYGDYHLAIYNIEDQKLLTDEKISQYYYIFQVKDNLYSISDNFALDLKLEGELPSNNTEVIISLKKANQLNLDIGSSLTIDQRDYQVTGIYERSYLNLEDLVLTKETGNSNSNIYFIYLNSFKNLHREIDNLINKFSNNPSFKNEALINCYDTSESPQAQVYILLLMFLSLVLAFIIFFIIYNAFSISVNEKKKSYAMYKSIGASPKQILYSVFLEALIILVLAIPLGFLLSLGFIYLILLIINTMLEGIATNIYTLEIYPIFMLISLVFILISTLFATFSIARMASRINVIDEVRQTKKFKYKKENKLIKKLFGIEGAISAKNVTRDRAKYRITTISVVIGIILFLTATTLLSILLSGTNSDELDDYIRVYFNPDHLQNITQEKIITEISNLESVDDFIYSESQNFRFETASNFNNTVRNNVRYIYINEDKYNKLKEYYNIDNDYPFLINTLDNGNKVFTDDIVSLELTGYNQTNKSVTANVVDDLGLLKDYYFDYSFIPIIIDKYSDSVGGFLSIYIIAEDYLKLDQEINKILEKDENIYYWNSFAINYSDVVKTNCIKLIIYLALLFITFITVVSIIGTISANLNLRRKEFAVLKSLGLSNKGFNKMIFYESLMLSLKSLLFGLLIFILIVVIFLRIAMIDNKTFSSLLDIPLNLFVLPLSICVIGVIVIVYLAFLIATRKIKKDNIVDVIKSY